MNQNPDLSSDHESLDDQKMPSVKYSDLELAMSFVSGGDMYDAAAYVSRKTGKIYWESSEMDEEDDIPDDLDDITLYAGVPHQHDLDLGKRLVMKFTGRAMLDQYDQVAAIFRRPGAYSRYKDLLYRNELLEEWYKFENSAIKSALREWADAEGFEVEYLEL